MKLFCVLLGEGTPFVVEIDSEHDTVADLQKIVLQTKARSIACDADQLVLYTTQHKPGQWLDDEDANIAELSHAEVSTTFFSKYLTSEHRMKPTRVVKEYCDDTTPQHNVIHVLVQLPQVVEAFTDFDNSTSTTQMLQEIYLALARNQQHAKTVYHHAEMTHAMGVKLMHEFGMYLERFKVREPEPKLEIPEFEWSHNDCKMQEKHREYLVEHLQDALEARELGLVTSDVMDDILRVEAPNKDVEFRGGADMVIVDDSVLRYPDSVGELPRLRMVIQVHRDAKFSRDRTYQAVSQLLATDLLVRRPTMCLMTNLTDYWRFFWLSTNRTVHSMVLSHPANAFDLMRNVVLATPSVTDEQKYWRSWFFDLLTNKNDQEQEGRQSRKSSCGSGSTVSSSE